LVNLVGGMAVGMLQLKMSAADAARSFSLMTIGDGLVNQIPSLIISVAAGIIVTRAGSRSHFGTDMQNQLLNQVRPLAIASLVLFFFALMPGLPTIPFLVLAVLSGVLALRRRKELALEAAEEEAATAEPTGPAKERIEDYLNLDSMEIELGYGLIALVDREAGGDLLTRITSLRRQVAQELGIIVPPIRIRDDLSLRPDEYRIRIRGNVVGASELRTGCILALTGPEELPGLNGIPTTDPTFGLPALWIRESERRNVESRGVAVVEPSAVLATHLETVVRRHAWRLLSLQDTKKLLENLKGEHQALVEELTPGILSLAAVHKVLQRLLKESVPVRDLCTVLETLADTGSQTKDTDILVEYARFALSGSITAQLKGEDGRIRVVTLRPELEGRLQQEQEGNRNGGFSPDEFAAVVAELAGWRDRLQAEGRVPVIVTRPEIRSYLRRLLEGPLPEMQVVSYSELQLDVELESVASIAAPEPNGARRPRVAAEPQPA
ncbi:MAG: FHIPEP family type III secretion protein, partial [Candidatus Cloacimonetes bacterium]|nr:FHIPEP family type III secretion protein [Candidatus Cloacimonadota bacterium]